MSHLDHKAVRRRFEKAAAGYDDHAVLQREVADRLLERLEFVRRPVHDVLDLGCGTGQATGQLLKRYPKARLLALDLALGMLQLSRRRGSWRRRPLALQADMHRLPLAAQRFDLVFSSLALQWSDRPGAVFDEVRRLLRADGLFLFATFGPATLFELREAWDAVDQLPHVNPFLDIQSLGDGLLAAGFRDPVMDLDTITLTYPDIFQLMRDLKGIGASNALAGRTRALTGRRRMGRLAEAYEVHRCNDRLPATFEVVYGLAYGPQALDSRSRTAGDEIPVSVDALQGPRRPGGRR